MRNLIDCVICVCMLTALYFNLTEKPKLHYSKTTYLEELR